MGEQTYHLGQPENVTQQVEIAAQSLTNASGAGDYRLHRPKNVSRTDVEVVTSENGNAATAQQPDHTWIGNVPQPMETKTTAVNIAAVSTGTAASTRPHTSSVPLNNQEIYQVIRAVAAGISGDDLYAYVDGSRPQEHGLRAGIIGFSQARGDLGEVLKIMHRRDPSLFAVIMGNDTDELLRVTSAERRETRLQPVGSNPLWHQEWKNKFHLAGQQEAFWAAQNETTIEHQFRPMLAAARELDIHSDRGLALLYDRVTALGLQEGTDWMRQRISPPEGMSETERLQTLMNSAGPDRERLTRIYDSELLEGVSYDF